MIVNEKFKSVFEDKTSEIICMYGGRGSGKSFCAAQKIVVRLLTEQPHRFVGIHKFQNKIKSTLYQQIVDVINAEGLQDEFICTTTPLEIKCKMNDNKIFFIGLDSGKVKSTTGITGVLIEEATFITLEDWRELYLSVRGEHTNYVQFILCYNPIDINSWINKYFHIDKIYKATLHHSTYKDNKFVGADYEAKLDANIDDIAYYRMAKYGEWASISEAIVFRNWNIFDEKIHGELSMDVYNYDDVTAGLDWGFQHNSCCLVVAKQNDKLIVLDEIYGNNLTNDEFMQRIKLKEYWNSVIYYADSAEPGRIKEFKLNGFNILPVRKGKNSVKYAIDFIKRFSIIIMPHCRNLIREISTFSYLYDEKSDIIYNEPAKNQEDDAIAALRYAVNPFLPIKKVQQLKAVCAL